MMKLRNALVLGALVLLGTSAFGQEAPKFEVPIFYSYMHFVPQNNNIVNSVNFNGGGGAAEIFFNRWFGLKAEFVGYASQTRTAVFPPGSLVCPGIGACAVSAQANMFTYNFGPIVKIRKSHFEPFLEAMGGGAHSNFYGNLAKNCGVVATCTVSRSPSNNAADFIIGGGVDIPVTTHFAIRPAEVDYVLTRFGNNFTFGNNNQSNFRYQGGIEFRF
jgi:hypothetical protein